MNIKKIVGALLCSLAVTTAFAQQPYGGCWHPDYIKDWTPEKDPDAKFNRSTVKLQPRIEGDNTKAHQYQFPEGQVAACLTMNPMCSMTPSQGANNFIGYNPTYWQYIDMVIWWGGSAGEGIIVPPSAPVIDACHMNGVKILGNVFFPPQAYSGDPEWVEQMLTKEGNTYPYAEKMYEIAKYYGFDGWFINEETYASTASDWVEWIKYFYQCAEADGNHDMYIQWYDASMYVNNALDIMMANPNTSFFANYGSAGKVTIEQHRSRGYRRVVQPARSPRRQGCSLYHRPRIMDDYPDCRTRSLWQGWNGYRRDYGKPRTGSSQPRQPGPKDGRSCRPGRKHRNLFDAGCFGESRTGRRDHHLRLDRRPDAGHLLHGCQGCRLHRDRESDREVTSRHTAQPLGVARPIT